MRCFFLVLVRLTGTGIGSVLSLATGIVFLSIKRLVEVIANGVEVKSVVVVVGVQAQEQSKVVPLMSDSYTIT